MSTVIAWLFAYVFFSMLFLVINGVNIAVEGVTNWVSSRLNGYVGTTKKIFIATLIIFLPILLIATIIAWASNLLGGVVEAEANNNL